jgi:NADP-dependent 3-hydroxy acid dehydrogenase YdfG
MKRLEGRVALVTGAGSGIGRATVRTFAAEGAHVYVTDVNGDAAQAVARELVEVGLKAQAVTADVSRGQDVTAMLRVVEKAHGRLDVLVNNAGLNVRGDFRHLSDADWAKIREVNLDGVVRVARDGFALLKASGRGSLINIASIMAHRGLRQLSAYSATKGAVVALTRGLAVEYAVRHPRQRCARASCTPRSPSGCSGTRRSRRRWLSPPRCAASASPRRSPRRPCSWRATRPPTSPAPSWRSTAACPRCCDAKQSFPTGPTLGQSRVRFRSSPVARGKAPRSRFSL